MLRFPQLKPVAGQSPKEVQQQGSNLLPAELFAVAQQIADCIVTSGHGNLSSITASVTVMPRDGIINFPRISLTIHGKTSKSKIITIVQWSIIQEEIIGDNNPIIIQWANNVSRKLNPRPMTPLGLDDKALAGNALSAISPLLYFAEEEGRRGKDYLPNLQAGEAYLFVDRVVNESECVSNDKGADNVSVVTYELIAAIARPDQSVTRMEVSMPGQPAECAIRRLVGFLLR